jgi:ribosome-associated toxin RatA of RatAB toxin-antitoxin module
MFDLIEAAEDYPAFVPWCAGATILARDDSVVVAIIRFSYHSVGFDFTTRNPKQRPHSMRVTQERGPFRRFEGDWRLTELAPDACRIEFALGYEFANPLLGRAASPIFERMAGRMVDIFVARADAIQASAAPPPTASAASTSVAAPASAAASASSVAPASPEAEPPSATPSGPEGADFPDRFHRSLRP